MDAGIQKSPQDEAATATLLLVDDEQNILSSLKRLFRATGYRILLANSGREGLEVLEREQVDLVISDMRMPEMDGATFLSLVADKWPETMRFILTGYADINSTIDAINKGKIYKYLTKPWNENDIKLDVRRAFELKRLETERKRLEILTKSQNEQLKELNLNLEKKVIERTEDLRKAHDSLKKGYVASVKVFSGIIEIREGTIAGHSRRVADLSRSVALTLGMGGAEVQDVLFAGLLHDIGKISLPDTLLSKAFKNLSSEERSEVNKHPEIGEAVLMSLEHLQGAARLIRSHHEMFNGKGFPDGLAGDEIPLGARILAVVNDFDALQTGVLDGRRHTEVEAREYVLKYRCIYYDDQVVDALIEVLDSENQKVNEAEITVTSDGLKPGMSLARDLITKSGVMLLPKGFVLDKNVIVKIQRLARASGAMMQIPVVAKRG